MFDIILLSILVIGFFIGFRRGFILQVFYFASFIAAIVVAYFYSDDISPFIKLWVPFPSLNGNSAVSFLFDTIKIEEIYYRAISFAALFFGTKLTLRMIGSMLNFLADVPILRTINGWLGGALGLVEVYLLMFILLYIANLLPIDTVQAFVNDSVLAKGMIEHTPIVSGKLKELSF
ncbi:CvpA family protein [Calidifontibacillus erzurumensis]|uniref:CvpA family protein n=1 Tax=Calidifontibacillus erzurumensis TaxID=2741433 RepID=A0A8J8GGV1_9BACI|nr:CvpA family protein [Calidifontibacillus erzurumensis]NSL51541.1 CvpA family protein [Calidifontibacillus erzurumensis]